MNNLIADLEAAPEGSRELDAKIELICWKGATYNYGPLIRQSGEIEIGAVDKSHNVVWSNCVKPPHYTTSLDAALTLVPQGWGVMDINMHENGRTWVALGKGMPVYNYEGHTPALALCIAALKGPSGNKIGECRIWKRKPQRFI